MMVSIVSSSRKSSFVESTASQNDLNNLLGDEDNGNMMKSWMSRRGVEESGMVGSNNNTTAVGGGEKHQVEASFVE